MTTEREHYLLERCLRLEARLAGIALPPIECCPDSVLLRDVLQWSQQVQRDVMPADIAQMRNLRRQGVSYVEIGHRLGFSHTTIRRYARDVQEA